MQTKKTKKDLKESLIISKLFILILSIFVFSLLLNQRFFDFTNKEIDVDMSNLTEYQRDQAYKLIKDLKPDYINLARKIVFKQYLDSNKYCGNVNCAGLNIFNGDIYIEYTDDYDKLKYRICHELIHSLFLNKNEEAIVDDIAKTDICYRGYNEFTK